MSTKQKEKENYSRRQLGRLIDQLILVNFLGKNGKNLTKNSHDFSQNPNNSTYHGVDWVEIFKTQPDKFSKEITKCLPVGLRRKCTAQIEEITLRTIRVSFKPKK